MAPNAQENDQKVHISLHLSISPPGTLSIDDAFPSTPLKLIATIKQTKSPFPDRAITIMTKYSCLEVDTPGSEGAFFSRAMASPQVTVPDPGCPAPELPLRPTKRVTITRVSGDPDLLKRGEENGFRFITIPPVSQGHAEVMWELTPSKLLLRLGDKGESLEEKMKRFLRPGDTYKIVPDNLRIQWWTFGSLDGGDGIGKKKIARWSLPDDLPLVREPGQDETDEVAHGLRDWIDLHDVNKLSSRSAVENEQKPDIARMRSEGWVFGEPKTGLVMTAENQEHGAQFTVVSDK
ncbi:hypothetical protein IAQ61_011743 [Plenodomus lingam]|uniref:Uncharacterized protein n=1 Tax=Leptosphaeria maculans (strain JN3 / isolate v23.1.3 / race Av1-4-5-6-7-8) TaxID=985895 RepID=E5AAZ1_LEPMJ|nr:hypothetical protein LEMA_P019620.1 [Plenodomus lingam JN3]KAH9859960.1 hypothetical protein IAQ61_011743 [Plenodomus lingam]CBY00832.1 hypothetical protein LEMA_P019620.1 [Plenodomus lingam JN3]